MCVVCVADSARVGFETWSEDGPALVVIARPGGVCEEHTRLGVCTKRGGRRVRKVRHDMHDVHSVCVQSVCLFRGETHFHTRMERHTHTSIHM